MCTILPCLSVSAFDLHWWWQLTPCARCLAPLIQICKDSADPDGDETTQLHCCEALKYITAVRMYQGRIREAGLISPLVVLTMKSENERVQVGRNWY